MIRDEAVISPNRASRCHRLINDFYLSRSSRLTTFLLSNDFPKKLFLVISVVFGTVKTAGKKTLAPSMITQYVLHSMKKHFNFGQDKKRKRRNYLAHLSRKFSETNHRADMKALFVCNTCEYSNTSFMV